MQPVVCAAIPVFVAEFRLSSHAIGYTGAKCVRSQTSTIFRLPQHECALSKSHTIARTSKRRHGRKDWYLGKSGGVTLSASSPIRTHRHFATDRCDSHRSTKRLRSQLVCSDYWGHCPGVFAARRSAGLAHAAQARRLCRCKHLHWMDTVNACSGVAARASRRATDGSDAPHSG